MYLSAPLAHGWPARLGLELARGALWRSIARQTVRVHILFELQAVMCCSPRFTWNRLRRPLLSRSSHAPRSKY